MLSISFYSGNGQAFHNVRVIDDFYEWLARWSTTDHGSSEFSKLGRSQQTQTQIEGKTAEFPLLPLGAETRSKLIEFFSEPIWVVRFDDPWVLMRFGLTDVIDCIS
jgi:hypothetical protein